MSEPRKGPRPTDLLKELENNPELRQMPILPEQLDPKRTGWTDLYDFLARGYKAFKPMKDIKYFVNVIRERELHILDNLFDNKPDPFKLRY